MKTTIRAGICWLIRFAEPHRWASFLVLILTASSLHADTGPSIITQPTSQKVAAGSSAELSVSADGTAPLYYQWRRNGADIPGATESSYLLGDVQSAGAGLYSVLVSNHVSSVISDEVSVSLDSVTAFADDFETGNLSTWSVVPGATTLTNVSGFFRPFGGAFTARASSSTDKMYHRVPNVDGRAKLSFWMFDTNQPRAYVEVRGFNGGEYTGTSNLFQLLAIGMFNSVSMPNETYAGTNFQGRVYVGTNTGWFGLNNPGTPRRSSAWHHFELERSSDGTYIDYYVDGVHGKRISGAAPAAWDFVTIGSVGTGGGTLGNAWFDDIMLEYYDPPVFIRHPVSQSANPGDSITFTAAASGDVMSYQWRFNGAAISGATNSALSLIQVDAAQAGTYTVIALNGVGAASSTNAVLSLTEVALPVVTSHPVDLAVNVGSPASFAVSATGADPLTYTWFKLLPGSTNALADGGNISGATTSTLSFSSVIETDAATYHVSVSNPAATVVSSNAILTVVAAPAIVAQPQPITLLADQTTTLTVTASGGALSYQWLWEGQSLPGATGSTLTLSNIQPNHAGNYSIIVSNSAGTITSTPAAVAVHYYLSALGSGGSVIKQPLQSSYAPGSIVTLTAASTPNYVFLNWSGDANGTSNPISVSMTSHKSVSAIFSNAVPDGKVIRDGNIDPSNLGKGDWIYFVSAATNRLGGNVSSVTNENSLMLWYKKQGIRYIIVKAGENRSLFNGSYNRPQFTNTLVDIAHQHGLLVFGYNRSYGQDIPAEASIVDYVFSQGGDGFVFDAEAEWESGHSWITNAPLQAWQLCGSARTNWPNKFIAYSPFAIISIHNEPPFNFPYKQFGYWCDAAIPMIYHYNWAQRSPSAAINWTDVGWIKWQNTCAHATNNPASFLGSSVYWTNAIKPLAPVGHVYGPNPPNSGVNELEPDDVTEWVDYLIADPHCPTAGGYKGFSFWRSDLHGAEQWTNIQALTGGDFPGTVNNIVIDDNQASLSGAWTHVRTFYNGTFYGNGSGKDTNSFGTNYFVINGGTGSSYATFTPNVVVAGDYDVYEWHVRRSDASTNVPFEINYNGGTANVRVNQQLNPGTWSRLGRFNFAAGTTSSIRITDDFSDAGTVAIVDGIKLVHVPSLVIESSAAIIRPEGGLQFDFTGAPGSVVEVQFRDSLTSGDWEPLMTITNVTGNATCVDPALNGQQRFYRLQLVP